MKIQTIMCKNLAVAVLFCWLASAASALTLTNPIVRVTQVHMPHENNGNVSNTFVSVVSLLGNHVADTEHAGRGGDGLCQPYSKRAVGFACLAFRR